MTAGIISHLAKNQHVLVSTINTCAAISFKIMLNVHYPETLRNSSNRFGFACICFIIIGWVWLALCCYQVSEFCDALLSFNVAKYKQWVLIWEAAIFFNQKGLILPLYPWGVCKAVFPWTWVSRNVDKCQILQMRWFPSRCWRMPSRR